MLTGNGTGLFWDGLTDWLVLEGQTHGWRVETLGLKMAAHLRPWPDSGGDVLRGRNLKVGTDLVSCFGLWAPQSLAPPPTVGVA